MEHSVTQNKKEAGCVLVFSLTAELMALPDTYFRTDADSSLHLYTEWQFVNHIIYTVNPVM